MYVIYAPMPRATAKASFGTDYRRARSQQRWCDRVGIRTGFGAPMRCDDSTDTRDRSASSCSACLTAEEPAKQDRREVTKSGADLEEIVESRTDCRRRINYEVRVGNPFFELILAACAWRADLIVVGAPDRQLFHLLGSTAERLVRKSFVPVLVSRKPLNQIAQRFLVPTDFSLGARRAAEVGINLADSFGGRIFFFHAFDPTPWYSYPCDEDTLGLITLPELTVDDVEGD